MPSKYFLELNYHELYILLAILFNRSRSAHSCASSLDNYNCKKVYFTAMNS